MHKTLPDAMPAAPTSARYLGPSLRPVGVDRENEVILGYIVAQEGPFKTPGRGEFDKQAIGSLVKLGNAHAKGLKSRFGHPTLSNDGLGAYLGRLKSFRKDFLEVDDAEAEGGKRRISIVRADLHFDPSAHSTPSGDLSTYLMDRIESDPSSLSSSVVIETDEEYRLDAKGRPQLDAEGNPLPPLWRPKRLHASDVVDTGDAVDGLLGLSADGLPDAVVRQASELLDAQFAGQPPEVVKARCLAWLDRYLGYRYPEFDDAEPPALSPEVATVTDVEPEAPAPELTSVADAAPEPFDPFDPAVLAVEIAAREAGL